MDLVYFLNMIEQHFKMVQTPLKLNSVHYYKYRDACYRQWAFDEISDYVRSQIKPAHHAPIERYMEILDNFMDLMVDFGSRDERSNFIFEIAGRAAEEVQDLLSSMI